MPTLFLTGFPGFLGSALVERLLRRTSKETTLTCLIQPKYRQRAEERVAALTSGSPKRADRLQLIEGDITRADLGLSTQATATLNDVREVYHLAAVYDLGISREQGLRVNVSGTRHVLRFATERPNLQRFHYVSTCYVSGRYDGTFTEDDLEKGQSFNNHYEETKFLAEVAVQEQMQAGLPATIYRPTIVVGDSRTGATQKYDGPYYFIQWMLRWSSLVPMPVVGDPRQHMVNLVPRNFVVDALTYLSDIEASKGTVYQLCDPAPLTVHELLTLFAEASGRTLVRIPLPQSLAKGALTQVPGLRRWTGIEPEAVDYFVQPTQYTCDRTLRDLDGTDITCPPITSYADRLVRFMQEHPEVSATAMA